MPARPVQRRAGAFGAVQLALLLAVLCPRSGAGQLHPQLMEWIRLGHGPFGRDVPIWVMFIDREFDSDSARSIALGKAQAGIGDAALARRARVGASLADEADLPVCPHYIAEIDRIGPIRHVSRWLNAVSVSIPVELIPRIAELPFVVEVRPVAIGRVSGLGPERGPDGRLLESSDPRRTIKRESRLFGEDGFPPVGPRDLSQGTYGPSFGQLDEIGVVSSHAEGYSGSRIILEMLDTGFRKDHHAFMLARRRILSEHDFVMNDGETQNEPEDDIYQHSHGTATWSSCGGFDPGNIVGPAYGATFVLAKTEDVRSETPVEEDNYVAALEWGDALGVQVTSASLIYLTFDDGGGWQWEDLNGHRAPISRAISRAAQRGILCVNAMGNYGPAPRTLGEPADADSMIACGAVDSTNQIANFSSRGPTVDRRRKPEVVARGVDTWAANSNGINEYVPVSGTSLSTPLIGGACALVLEAHPEWSAFQARTALMQTADRANHPDDTYGMGRIDVLAAIHHAPLVVPKPFSLVFPGIGDTVLTPYPQFTWNRSVDPENESVTYELWIDDSVDFVSPAVYSGLVDTTFTVPDPLVSSTGLNWRVVAEDPDGYRRLCREDRFFNSLGLAEGHELVSDPSAAWRIEPAPNPFRGSASLIRWYAPPGSREKEVILSILDPAGRRLVRNRLTVPREGWNESRWDGRTGEGEDVPSGIYLVLLEASGQIARAKIVLTR
jgi:hypothetical protein